MCYSTTHETTSVDGRRADRPGRSHVRVLRASAVRDWVPDAHYHPVGRSSFVAVEQAHDQRGSASMTRAIDSGAIGVAISTTGDPHRMKFLETSVEGWRKVLPLGSVLVVTIDGDEDDLQRARLAADPAKYGVVYRVGQSDTKQARLGVATNKNTGLELLMSHGVKHLFLCDDDTYPLSLEALNLHTEQSDSMPHSMICWGKSRKPTVVLDHRGSVGYWSWPRGVLLYQTRDVVERVGGFVEEFGPGGHEHVEYSRRISQTLYPDRSLVTAFLSPLAYVRDNAMGARRYWHCEDMPQLGEPLGNHRLRRKRLTSIRRLESDWPRIEALMQRMDGHTDFVPYQASENGRSSATMCTVPMGRGAEE